MTLLLTALRWLGLRGAVALLALSLAGWQGLVAHSRANQLAALQAKLDTANAERIAAQLVSIDFARRAEIAVEAQREAEEAAEAARKDRARKWSRIRESERAWSEVPVPEAVVEALR